MTEKENKDNCTGIIRMNGPQTNISGTNGKESTFTYDHCYFQDATSRDVYQDLGLPLLEKALEGYNATIFAYGQTGSGKTHCMTGTAKEPGIIPMLNSNLFKHIEFAPPNKKYLITVSYLEIYQEMIHDLLNPHGKDMRVREHPQLGIYIEGLAEIVVRNGKDIAQLQEQGNRVRKVAATEMNQRSSRSHSIFTLHIKQRDTDDPEEQGLKAKVNLVDLAGSERANATGAQGQTFKEGAAINKSLSALGNVINSLADPKRRNKHVPYRDSKLTRILEESLGGNCVTIMLAMISPADCNYAETLSTLQFANRAKNIKNTTKKNEDENTRAIRELREEIALLRNSMTQQDNASAASTMSPKEVTRLEAMISDLQMAKKQTWEEKQRLSEMYENERKKNLANKGILDLVLDTLKREQHEAQERLKLFYEDKEQLTEKYREGKKIVENLKEQLQQKISEYSNLSKEDDSGAHVRLNMIHSLKETLQKESEQLKVVKELLKNVQEKIKSEKEETKMQSNLLRGNVELRERILTDEREKLARENSAILKDKLDMLMLELEKEKADLKFKVVEEGYNLKEHVTMETELIELRAQISMTRLQKETLEEEKQQLSQDFKEAFRRHKEDLETQEKEYFEVFRAYREAYEEQRLVVEKRFRKLLEESIQDAIYMAATNSQLCSQMQEMRQEMNILKDILSRAGLPHP